MGKQRNRDQLFLDALEKPFKIEETIEGSKKLENMHRIKRQKVEFETYTKLYEEYLSLFKLKEDANVPTVIRSLNKLRLRRIEVQLKDLSNTCTDEQKFSPLNVLVIVLEIHSENEFILNAGNHDNDNSEADLRL